MPFVRVDAKSIKIMMNQALMIAHDPNQVFDLVDKKSKLLQPLQTPHRIEPETEKNNRR